MDGIFNIKSKVVVVTGSGRGNGKAIADGFLKRGSLVCGIDIHFEELEKEYENYFKISFNLEELDKIPELVKIIYNRHRRIDVLINNAGISLSGENPYNEELLEKTLTVNLKAPYILSYHVAKVMSKKKAGSIINITSLGASLGFPDNPSYQVSKSALWQLTKALAIDFGKYNIRVNNICPGYILTSMTKKSYENKRLYKERLKRIILNRWGTPNDLVGACIFLASDASAYITGIELVVDGGWQAKGL